MDHGANAAAPRDRWYVLAILTLVYALNIADRFSISTLIEPIRQELHLSDSGIALLTGVALALFYVTVGIPVATLADRTSRRNILALSLAIWSGMTAVCGLAQKLLATVVGAVCCRDRRSRRYAAFHINSRGQVSASPATDGSDDFRAGREPRRVVGFVHCRWRG
jgi:MFS family permease